LTEAGDEREVAAIVTDRHGGPVANVTVELRETGPAAFTPSGTDAVLVTTGTDGVARAVLTSIEDGRSTIVAEISPPGTSGSFRGPGPADDECEQPAGTNGVPAAGICTSQPLSVEWEEEIVAGFECDDGIDNDGDGYVDYGDDPGCISEQDDSEQPVDGGDVWVRHDRTVGFRFRHLLGPGDGLAVSGRVRVQDGYVRCARNEEIRIQRLVDGRWDTKDRLRTDSLGRFESVIPDRPGSYRVRVRRSEIVEDESVFHVCRQAHEDKRHRHRG
jgi:hypothetical protein